MIVGRKVTLKLWITCDKTLFSNYCTLLSVTHSGNKINQSKLNLQCVGHSMTEGKSSYEMKNQRMNISLHARAALMSASLVPKARPPSKHWVSFTQTMRQQTAHDSMLGNAWHTLFLSTDLKHSSQLTKVIYGDWMTGTVPFFSSLSPPSPLDYEEG